MDKPELKKIYDCFIGREIMGDGPVKYTLVNLHNGAGSTPYSSDPKQALENIFEYLCDSVISVKKIFLYCSIPARPAKIMTKANSEKNIKDIFAILDDNIPDFQIMQNKASLYNIIGEARLIPETKFLPFTNQEMDQIKEMYSKREDLKKYPNPFGYQPGMN